MTDEERARFARKILELEAQLEDAYIKIDLAECERDDLKEENRALRGQLQILRTDRRYVVG